MSAMTLHRRSPETERSGEIFPAASASASDAVLRAHMAALQRDADALQQRLRLETAIARIAASLTAPDVLDVNDVLGELGRAVDVHRTYIFRFRPDGITCDNTHEWCAEGVVPQIEHLQGTDTSPLVWWMGQMREGRQVVIPDLSTLPPEAEAERELLSMQDIKSLLAVPIMSREQGLLGFMGFDDVQRTRTWHEDDVRALRTACDLLASELDRRLLEAQLRQAQKMEAVGQLAGGIAHDFNNLITVVVGHASLLLDQLPDDVSARAHALEIRRAAERASQLTTQLLAFSRKQILNPMLLDVCETVRETELMLSRVIGSQIVLHADVSSRDAVVRADPVQLQQVLLNLVMNARDAMPSGGDVRVRVDTVPLPSPLTSPAGVVPVGDWVMLEVSDTGEGMAADVLPRIFEPFFTTKADGKGTGLGLPTVYGIVQQSGGHMWVESTPGAGTTFRIYLPRIQAPRRADVVTPNGSLPAEGGLSIGTGRIFLVEDDATVRMIVEEVLKRAGYEVIGSPTPHEALARAESLDQVDLILTDMLMPGMDGAELVSRLRRQWPTVPVLVMSAYAERDLAEREILDAGHRFIGKPFTPRALADTVRSMLRPPNASAA
jgi:signal transduction histidine kinase